MSIWTGKQIKAIHPRRQQKMRISNRSIFRPRGRGAYRVENKAAADETTVYIYDEISWWGVDAKQFVKDFNEITASTIHLRINSPGGSVFDGTTIYNTIKQHKSKTIIHIDGLAASIASVIAMAGDEVRMAENAFLMIHEPFSLVIGTAKDMRDEADLLDKVGGTIAKTYTQKSGKEDAEIKEMMAAETWMTAEEALENGFIDEIEKTDEKSDKSAAVMFDLSAFANVPDALKEQKKDPSIRDLEKALTDAGVSQKQAKAILADGFRDAQRDAEPPVVEPPAEPQRDAEKPVENVAPQRDAEEPKVQKKDRTIELLARAERMAPSKPEAGPQFGHFL
jgi:ATP-dependent Clp protease protease subunit